MTRGAGGIQLWRHGAGRLHADPAPRGKLTKLLDTDWQCFGGRTEKPKRLVGKACGGELKLTLAPFSGQLFKLV